VFWNLFTSRFKTQSCVDKKNLFYDWDSSSKQWLIGPNWPLLGPIRRILSYVTASGHIFRLTFRSLSDVSYSDECRTKKAFSMSKECCQFSYLNDNIAHTRRNQSSQNLIALNEGKHYQTNEKNHGSSR